VAVPADDGLPEYEGKLDEPREQPKARTVLAAATPNNLRSRRKHE